MASNSEDRNYRRKIKLFEEEEIDRRLKGITILRIYPLKYMYFCCLSTAADLYEHSYSYDEKKKVLQVLEESCEQSRTNISKSRNESFEESFHIVNVEEESKEATDESSLKQNSKPDWKCVVTNNQNSDEDGSNSIVQKPGSSAVMPSKTIYKNNKLNVQKGIRPVNGNDFKKSVESRGSKMLAASLRKNELSSEPIPSHSKEPDVTLDKLNQPIKPKFTTEVDEILKETIPSYQKKQALSERNDVSDDDDFTSTLSLKDNKKFDRLLPGLNQLPKSKVLAMKSRAKKFAEVLKKAEQCRPYPFPDVKNFGCTGSYQKLVDNEEQMKKMSQDTSYKLAKWKKPIILNALGNRKRCLNLSTSSSPRYDAQGADAFEIPDSPPVSSLRKLDLGKDLSAVSSVLEPGVSRNKSTRSNEVDDTEMESGIFEFKPTSETKEVV